MDITDEFDSFLNEETNPVEQKKIDIKAKEIEKEDNYKRDKTELKSSVEELQNNINAMLKEIDVPIDSMIPNSSVLPSLDIINENHDYEKDIELIKIESKETLECLANLYLDEDTMKNKNLYNIIKNDSQKISDMNFSISCSKRALINCMKQLDMGVNEPEMYESVSMFQKELRESINSLYNLEKKMKDFYKDFKNELGTINMGKDILSKEPQNNDTYTIIGDPKLLNDIFEKYKNDPSLLQELENQMNNE